ncbi:hypothetical protein JTE90_010546 [Oedothorax gibbosus]|uniref:Uncharacterized protein n=1 Tax=Oedothorax gibbosus TaxID=931172 RepID=A0AAV6U3E2_9ARAC|nr:hypothetical protein JTE90_010546 [Oedothorax gibbosus]
MGAGGSTSRPNSATVVMSDDRRPQTASRGSSSARASDHNRPTDSCCSHYKENHVGLTRTVSRADTVGRTDSIDDEIEEIVANTLDIVSRRTSRANTPVVVPPRDVPSSAVSSSGVRRILRSASARRHQKRASSDEVDTQYDAKDAIPEVDFAKFKKVNHQGATMQNNGRIIHHQESDLLWRLGLISPEAYKITTTTRSAPNNQGPYMKTPSYDLTEEQLMANIEKEFECTT